MDRGRNEAQETFSMIAYVTQLTFEFSQSITNKVIRAAKAVYDFVVYIGCEIGKHNYTIQCYLYDRLCCFSEWVAPKMKDVADVAA